MFTGCFCKLWIEILYVYDVCQVQIGLNLVQYFTIEYWFIKISLLGGCND